MMHEKMTRDEIEYMLTKSEETLDADEIDVTRIFSLDELMAREAAVPRRCLYGGYSDDSQTIIQSILAKFLTYPCLWWG